MFSQMLLANSAKHLDQLILAHIGRRPGQSKFVEYSRQPPFLHYLRHRQFALVKKLPRGLHYRGQRCIGIGRQEVLDIDDRLADG